MGNKIKHWNYLHTCPVCGIVFQGRSDKIFCSEKCKNRFHNNRNKKESRSRSRIIRALERNYSILTSLILDEKKEAEVSDLSLQGFNKNLVTGYNYGPGDKVCMRCFDIKYCQSETSIYNLSKEKTETR